MKKEFFGSSVAETVGRAAAVLGIPEDQIKYLILEGGFGLQSKDQKVAIIVDYDEKEIKTREEKPSFEEETRARASGEINWAVFVCDGIFARMGYTTKTRAVESQEEVILEVEIPEGQLDMRRGETRDLRGAIQHLINRVAARGGAESERKYIVDIGCTLAKRTQKISELAGEIGKQVGQIGKPVHVHLMDSQDRRILHLALMNLPNLTTQGRGEKQFRILSLEPKVGA
jgi:predicted RNA-binding protein Jag